MKPRDIELTLYTSRPCVEIGEPFEVILKIENYGDNNIWISNITTSLSLTAEVRAPSQRKVSGSAGNLPSIFAGPGVDTVKISPGSSYSVIWRHNEEHSKDNYFMNLLWEVFFHPGVYKYFAEVHFWTERPDHVALYKAHELGKNKEECDLANTLSMLRNTLRRRKSAEDGVFEENSDLADISQSANNEHQDHDIDLAKRSLFDVMDKSMTLTCEGNSEFTIKSTTIFFGALLGAVLAFFLRQMHIIYASSTFSFAELWILPLYCITSVIVVLLLNRVSEAKIPLTIRIMDFWGACTLGLIGAFGGQYIIGRILSALTSTATSG